MRTMNARFQRGAKRRASRSSMSPGFLAFSMFSAFLAVPAEKAASQEISLIRTAEGGGGVSLRIPERLGQWIRLEWSSNLLDWRIAKDSVAGPAEVAAVRPGRNVVFYRARGFPKPDGPFVVAVVGDSTAAGDFPEQDPPRVFGWGDALTPFTNAETMILMAAAQPALGTKTFFSSPHRPAEILARFEPEIVLIQLGQIDEFSPLMELNATSIEEYRANLNRIIDLVRGWNGAPILVTLLPFRPNGRWAEAWPTNGRPISEEDKARQAGRSEAVRQLAVERGAYLIDLHQIVGDFYLFLSPGELENLTAYDAHHLSEEGAKAVAGLVVRALPPHFQKLFFQGGRSEP